MYFPDSNYIKPLLYFLNLLQADNPAQTSTATPMPTARRVRGDRSVAVDRVTPGTDRHVNRGRTEMTVGRSTTATRGQTVYMMTPQGNMPVSAGEDTRVRYCYYNLGLIVSDCL